VNWRDNPWFPVELENERRHAGESGSKDLYLHTWEGHCLRVLDGAVYADEMRKMREEGRIGRVPYEPSKPVYTFWDLGFGDNTAIWFVQSVGMQIRVIDYYSANQELVDKAIAEVDAMYKKMVYPDMQINWTTHPDNVGHKNPPGCFRCHDERKATKGEKTITQDCNNCHSLLAMDEATPKILTDLGFEKPKTD